MIRYSSPGMFSLRGLDPVVMTMYFALIFLSPIIRVDSSSKLAIPWYVLILASLNPCSFCGGCGSVKVFLKSISEGQSITCFSFPVPFPSILLLASTMSAAPVSTFLGIQPLKAHVPPYSLQSTIATFIPAEFNLYANVVPAEPVPITTTSYSSFISLPH